MQLPIALEAQLLVWNEWKHNDSIVLFEDLLALIKGELMEIRVPCKKNVPHRNTAPLFFTSNSPLYVVRQDPSAMVKLNTAMNEAFCTRVWAIPLPKAERIANFPRCGRCCANFFLLHR